MNRLIVVVAVFLLLASACRSSFEVCDADGAVYNMLKSNYTDWSLFFTQPENYDENIIIRVGNSPYRVDLFEKTQDGQPIIYVPTNMGIPASIMGESGYFYTPEMRFDMGDDRYSLTLIEPHFYCYRRTR